MKTCTARLASLTVAALITPSTVVAQFSCISFAAPQVIPLPRFVNNISCADIDADGRLDLVSTSQNVVHLLYGGSEFGSGSLDSIEIAGSSEDYPTFVIDTALADFTGDGVIDIALLIVDPSIVRILPGHGDRSFGDPVDYSVAIDAMTNGALISLTAADFNMDGVDDIFVGRRWGNSSLRRSPVLLSDGKGSLTLEPAPEIPHGSYYGVVVDINGDGDNDVVSASAFGPTGAVLVFDNDGDGHFTTRQYEPAHQEFMDQFNSVAPTCASAADFDLDGDIDLAVITVIGTVSIFEQIDGEFVESIVMFPGDFGWYIHAADLNEDGRVDLVLGKPLGRARLQVMENTSSGGEFAFGSPFAIASTGFPRNIIARDFDDQPGIDVIFAAAAEDAFGGFGLVSAALPEEVNCVYDLSGNGIVDPVDLSIVLAFWDAPGTPADLTQDRKVNIHDVATLLSTWGAIANPNAAFPQYNWGYGQRSTDTTGRQAIHDAALAAGADLNKDGRVNPAELANWIATR